MPISLSQHRAGITQTVVGRFSDAQRPKAGLGAFFPRETVATKAVSIEVERNRRLVAVDVQRCTDGNRNIFSTSTEKIFIPPFFSEFFDFTACQAYDITFGRGVAPSKMDAKTLAQSATSYLEILRDKIERAILKQQAQVLQTGVVTLKNGDSIDYKRKAESMVTLAGAAKWDAPTTAKPLTDLKNAVNFLRDTGLSSAVMVDAIMGTAAFAAFMSSNEVKEQADWKNIKRVDLGMPKYDNVTGMVFQGQIAAGDYMINIWTYIDSYEENGTSYRYLDTDKVVVLPDDFEGKTVFAGIPMVFGDPVTGQYIAPQQGEYVFHDVIDQIKRVWDFYLESAPLVIPFSVDRIATIDVL